MNDSEQPLQQAGEKTLEGMARNPWVMPATGIAVLAILTFAALYVFKSCRDLPVELAEKTGRTIDKAATAVVDVLTAFRRGQVTTSFISYATSIHPSHHLQFAKIHQMEIFTRRDEASTAFGYIRLPDVVVEARAPVEYTYYLDLNAAWTLTLTNEIIYVVAPRIRYNKPAVDASEITYEIRQSSALRDTAEAQQNLKESITFMANRKARENIALVRETARKQVTDFVEKWLLHSFPDDGRRYPIKVFFADEKLPESIQMSDRPLQ